MNIILPFYTIMVFTQPKNLKNLENNYSSITSSFITNNLPINFDLIKKLSKLYSTIKIIYVVKELNELNHEKVDENLVNIELISIPYLDFFSEEGIDNYIINNLYLDDTIFIFKNELYHNICKNLALNNLVISGGSNTMKHILSPIQVRLARFIISINNKLDIAKSFHDNLNNFNKSKINYRDKKINSLIKSSSLENRKILIRKHFELYNENYKKEMHTLINQNEYIITYLDLIKEIINNPDHSREEAQTLIENTWLNLITNKLNDEKFFITKT